MACSLDIDSLSPERRRQELAAILAAGLLRLPSSIPVADFRQDSGLKDSSNSGPNCLEVSGETRLSVQSG
jgi:hypothetical protein